VSAIRLLRFPRAIEHDPAVSRWFADRPGELGAIARKWFAIMRGSGADVRELVHDGAPTACIGDAAFAYVNTFKAHVDVGFFRGADLRDPRKLLEGTGKHMRHVKLRPGALPEPAALEALIAEAYSDMLARLRSGAA
jgi:hypothetical protein